LQQDDVVAECSEGYCRGAGNVDLLLKMTDTLQGELGVLLIPSADPP